LTLPDAEYQRCSHTHIAAGTSTTDEGRTMSINVETIGDAVIVQHHVAEVKEAALCRMVSISDAISKNGRTKVKVEWVLSARKIDDHPLKLVDEIYTEKELVSCSSTVVSASIPRMVKPQLRP
jgi:NADPH-dependent 2,4-dienoyl-CoA reductase/sulfur reductase-like enzyme